MIETFVKGIYETIVKDNGEIYKELFESTIVNKTTDEYWVKSINLYSSLSDENKTVLMNIIKQTMIDTVSNVFGIIDGSSTLNGCDIQTKLLLDGVDTDSELQDAFLSFVDETSK